MKIEDLERDYQDFASSSLNIGKKITSSVSMMQLNEVNESVAEAVLQIEGLINKGSTKSRFAKLPFFGKFIEKASETVKETQLKTGNMVEVVDAMFQSLTIKKDNIIEVMSTLFELQEQLASEVAIMEKNEEAAKIIAQEDSMDGVKARNLLIRIQQTLVKAIDRIGIIRATIRSAEASTSCISQLLPTLQGELITELALSAGLQELKEFKEIFDLTIATAEDLNVSNNGAMKSVMLEVVDLAIATPTDIARLSDLNRDRMEFQDKLQKRMNDRKAEQAEGLKVLAEVRNTQPVLELK